MSRPPCQNDAADGPGESSFGRCRWLPLVVIALAAMNGCGAREDVDSTYGRRRGVLGGGSVNGTGVLAGMFEEAGYRVTSSRRLARAVESADVVVWFPDDHHPPNAVTTEYFTDWLSRRAGRKLVFVGRDYDAVVAYWERMRRTAPAEQAFECRRQRARSQSAWHERLARLPAKDECDWFRLRRDRPPRRVTTVTGLWSQGINASKLDIVLNTRLTLSSQEAQPNASGGAPEWYTNSGARTLLGSEDELLAGCLDQPYHEDRKIIVVADGSWLLNLPLVNHEHRKLAGRLIDECGTPGKCVFLESGAGGPPISSGARRHHGLEAFTVWPVNCILFHLTVLGMVYCFSVFPIFGRPRRLDDETPSDFGKHITALGGLLAKTEDAHYAQTQLAHYHQTVKKDTNPTMTAEAPTAAGGNPFAKTAESLTARKSSQDPTA